MNPNKPSFEDKLRFIKDKLYEYDLGYIPLKDKNHIDVVYNMLGYTIVPPQEILDQDSSGTLEMYLGLSFFFNLYDDRAFKERCLKAQNKGCWIAKILPLILGSRKELRQKAPYESSGETSKNELDFYVEFKENEGMFHYYLFHKNRNKTNLIRSVQCLYLPACLDYSKMQFYSYRNKLVTFLQKKIAEDHPLALHTFAEVYRSEGYSKETYRPMFVESLEKNHCRRSLCVLIESHPDIEQLKLLYKHRKRFLNHEINGFLELIFGHSSIICDQDIEAILTDESFFSVDDIEAIADRKDKLYIGALRRKYKLHCF